VLFKVMQPIEHLVPTVSAEGWGKVSEGSQRGARHLGARRSVPQSATPRSGSKRAKGSSLKISVGFLCDRKLTE